MTARRAPLRDAIRRHPVWAFVVLAYASTFLFRVPLAASAAGLLSVEVPRYFQFLGDLGPLLAALALAALLGRDALRAQVADWARWRAPGWTYALALLGPVLLFAAAALVARVAFGAPWPDLALLGRWEELPTLPPPATWLFLVLVIGVGEETGWRGFMLPRLAASRGPVAAALLVGLAWIFWHLPTFVFDPQFASMPWPYRAGWAALLLCASVAYAWLYEAGGRRVLPVVLLHGTNDFLLGSLGARDPVLNVVWGVSFVPLAVLAFLALRRMGARPGGRAPTEIAA